MVRQVSRRAAARSAFTLLEVLTVMTIIVIIVGLGTTYVLRSLDDARKDTARIGAKNLESAAMKYEVKFGNRPDNLQQLVQPPDGGKPYIEAEGLRDPWGNTYQYDPAGGRNASLKPDVWTVSPDGVTIGNWPNK